jgi:hypothetical protein
MTQLSPGARRAMFLLGAAFLISPAAADDAGSLQIPTLRDAPCELERVVSDAQRRAADETARMTAEKEKDLDSAEQRANRSDERIKKGDNFTWEGGGSRQHYSLDLPQVTVEYAIKSFDFVQTAMKETRTHFGRFETCWWTVKAGFINIKTKGTCWRESDIVWSVPQFKWGRVEIRMPTVKIGSKRQDFYWDLPTVTVRDNKGDLDKANDDTARTRRELEQGTEAIRVRVMSSAREQVTGILDNASKDSDAALDTAKAKALEPLLKQKQDLTKGRDAARAALAAAGKGGEADAAFAEAFKMLDKSLADVAAGFESARDDVHKQIAALKDAYLGDGKSAVAACGPKQGVSQ